MPRWPQAREVAARRSSDISQLQVRHVWYAYLCCNCTFNYGGSRRIGRRLARQRAGPADGPCPGEAKRPRPAPTRHPQINNKNLQARLLLPAGRHAMTEPSPRVGAAGGDTAVRRTSMRRHQIVHCARTNDPPPLFLLPPSSPPSPRALPNGAQEQLGLQREQSVEARRLYTERLSELQVGPGPVLPPYSPPPPSHTHIPSKPGRKEAAPPPKKKQ